MVAKNRMAFVAIFTVILAVIMAGFLLFSWQLGDRSPAEPAEATNTAVNLGITYLPITPKLSSYYDLGVESGVLVTEVIPYSPADKAGVKVDDIIVSYNRVRLEEEVSLFGMMRACSSDNRIVLGVLREKGASIIELIYMEP